MLSSTGSSLWSVRVAGELLDEVERGAAGDSIFATPDPLPARRSMLPETSMRIAAARPSRSAIGCAGASAASIRRSATRATIGVAAGRLPDVD